jgi:hypothetical protein
VTRIGELGTTLAATSNGRTRATRRNIPEDTILHSHHRENHKSYREGTCSAAKQLCGACTEYLAALPLTPFVAASRSADSAFVAVIDDSAVKRRCWAVVEH